MRRLKILNVSSELFRCLLIQDGTVALRVNGIPSDVEIRDAQYDMIRDLYAFKLESASFPEAKPGSCLESLEPTLEEVRLDRIERDAIARYLQNCGYSQLAEAIQRCEHHHPADEPQVREASAT